MDAQRGILCLWCSTALFLLSLSLQQQVAEGQLAIIYSSCLRNTTSLSSTFTQNLQTALRNFTSLSSQGTKDAANIVGSSSTDRVYAVFQCRGDLSPQTCSECMQIATSSLPSDCPKSVGARIQVDACFLRYDNQSFFVLDTTYVMGLCNTATTSDVVPLAITQALMDIVTQRAPKQGGYDSESINGLYATAQCLGYLNQSECSQCLLNVPYSLVCNSSKGERVFLASCNYRYESSPFLEAASPAPSQLEAVSPGPSPAATTVMSLPPSLLTHGSKTSGSRPITIAVSVVVGVVIVLGAILLLWRYKGKHIKRFEGVKLVDEADSWSSTTKAQVFSLRELEEATAHFHPTNKLGEGGFGIVYKGTLLGGEEVAIKKLSVGSQQGKQEFLNEVNLITSVQHKNLVRLLGCCVESAERILVYEYLPNKSLDFFLYGEERERTLNWSTRYDIISGTAKGLAYLHEESHLRIIHWDIKPSNILLGKHLNPVIADFGLARLIDDNASFVNTRVAGTLFGKSTLKKKLWTWWMRS